MRRTSRGARRRITRGALLRAAVLVLALTLLMAGTASAAGYNLYFGDLHAHTDYSDGTGTPAQAYAAAKAAGADFFATTDHNHCSYGDGWMTTENWADTLAVADAYNKDGVFVTFPGYERWLPWMTTGEMNVFNTAEIYAQDGNPAGNGYNNGHNGGLADLLPTMYDWLAAQGAVGQWNHPDYYGNDASANSDWYDFGFYTPQRDEAVDMIEIWNEITYEPAYVRALDAGWHVIPTANSDTHYADWITGCDVRTVLLADGLTRAKLLAAMRASRGYATEDKDLEIRYSLGGKVMGSTLVPAAGYKASIQIVDPGGAKDAIRLVELVSDGGAVVAKKAFDSASVTWTPTVSSSTARYFYVRVTTASDFWGDVGVTAWTAPVWTGR
jgi:hypothetical protein